MPYTTQAQLETEIPPPHLIEALDDDGDGVADAGQLDAVIASASQAVDALLSPRFSVPFADPAPAPVREAAFAFAGEKIYLRRPQGERNPFKTRADFWREHLAKIGRGEAELDAATVRAFTPGAAITESVSVDASMG
jgi:hypothetical protein